MSQQYKQPSNDEILSSPSSKLTYSAPQISILGKAEELTKANESCESLDCGLPAAGCDDVCS